MTVKVFAVAKGNTADVVGKGRIRRGTRIRARNPAAGIPRNPSVYAHAV